MDMRFSPIFVLFYFYVVILLRCLLKVKSVSSEPIGNTNNFPDTISILNSSHPKVLLQIETMGVNGIQNCLVTNTLHKLFYVQQKNEMQTGLEQHEAVFSFLGGLSLYLCITEFCLVSFFYVVTYSLCNIHSIFG